MFLSLPRIDYKLKKEKTSKNLWFYVAWPFCDHKEWLKVETTVEKQGSILGFHFIEFVDLSHDHIYTTIKKWTTLKYAFIAELWQYVNMIQICTVNSDEL